MVTQSLILVRSRPILCSCPNSLQANAVDAILQLLIQLGSAVHLVCSVCNFVGFCVSNFSFAYCTQPLYAILFECLPTFSRRVPLSDTFRMHCCTVLLLPSSVICAHYHLVACITYRVRGGGGCFDTMNGIATMPPYFLFLLFAQNLLRIVPFCCRLLADVLAH